MLGVRDLQSRVCRLAAVDRGGSRWCAVSTTVQYRVVGMDCADDAREIEAAVRALPTVADARVSVASQVLTLRLLVDQPATDINTTIEALGYRLDSIDDKSATHLTAQYRRALWIVVLLNVGFGVAEIIAGFIARSQALKADALDFLGDGLITLFGIAALGWSLLWRARAALMQGMFLGALGVAVVVSTIYRIFVQQQPEAEVMGLMAVLALLVNVGAAAVLIPHRAEDANARAIWLFSRNDAIGNAAVIVAAVLVGWTRTPWPDLVVAAIVASLFLHSAWAIIRDAGTDLRNA